MDPEAPKRDLVLSSLDNRIQRLAPDVRYRDYYHTFLKPRPVVVVCPKVVSWVDILNIGAKRGAGARQPQMTLCQESPGKKRFKTPSSS